MNILIVDDQEMIIRSISTYLKTQGFTNISTLTDSREVLTSVSNNHFDVILLDLNIPHLSGQDLITPLMNIDPNIDIIIISAMDHKRTIENCKCLGAIDYFIKPLDNNRLIRTLKQIKKCKHTNQPA